MARALDSKVSVIILAVVWLLVSLALQSVECQEQLTVESRQQKDNDDLTDTIKYLENLDKYISQKARPRFGRSDLKQPQQLRLSPAVSPAAYRPLQLDPLQYGALVSLINSRLTRG